MCFAPTTRHCSPPVALCLPPSFLRVPLSLPTAVPATTPAAPVVVPTRVTCPRINTATDRRPNPIRPSSQPATPCPTYFPRYAPPYTILECRFPFWVRSAEPRHPPSLVRILTPAILRVFLFPSLSPSQASTAVALFLFVPLPFLFLLTSLLVLRLAHRASIVRYPSRVPSRPPSTCRKV